MVVLTTLYVLKLGKILLLCKDNFSGRSRPKKLPALGPLSLSSTLSFRFGENHHVMDIVCNGYSFVRRPLLYPVLWQRVWLSVIHSLVVLRLPVLSCQIFAGRGKA